MRHTDLPEAFLDNMKSLLGEEYPEYIQSFDQDRICGLRFNPLRFGRGPHGPERLGDFLSRLKWKEKPVAWAERGFYYREDMRPAKDPYYYAGLYYVQEPSAMAPAAMLPVEPGDRVLDLCAAPGGKSTELGARLMGEGVLVANDISSSRAKALLKNLELWGIPNYYLTSETPEHLAEVFPSCFDKILVDAPCSGEGMFRKEPDMVKSWEKRGPADYVPIQRDILRQAAKLLAPGGLLLYSTCTFDPREDEEQILWILKERPELELRPLPLPQGAVTGIGLAGAVRFFPHKVEGEGHFMALLSKKGENRELPVPRSAALSGQNRDPGVPGPEAGAFLAHLAFQWDPARFYKNNDSLYYLPDKLPAVKGIRYLRTGLWLGDVRRGRFEPSQALAMTLSPRDCDFALSLSHEDERVIRYLKGETIRLEEGESHENGWRLVCVEDFPLGFAKEENGRLKNKYHPGWRWQA